MARQLTAKQQAFVDAYLENGGNATRAYRTAYATQASDKVCGVEGFKLLKHPGIALKLQGVQEIVQAARAEKTAIALERYAVTAENVVSGLAKLAFSDIRAVVPESGILTAAELRALPDEVAFCIQEVVSLPNGQVKVKLADKRGPLVDLGKILKLFVEQRENTILGADGKPIDPRQTFVLTIER